PTTARRVDAPRLRRGLRRLASRHGTAVARGRCRLHRSRHDRDDAARCSADRRAARLWSAGAMTWLIPSAIAIAAGASLVAIALHFIARSRPVAEVFPTARFIPQRAIHARTRSLALTDVLLLLLRVLAIMLLGVAVAG